MYPQPPHPVSLTIQVCTLLLSPRLSLSMYVPLNVSWESLVAISVVNDYFVFWTHAVESEHYIYSILICIKRTKVSISPKNHKIKSWPSCCIKEYIIRFYFTTTFHLYIPFNLGLKKILLKGNINVMVVLWWWQCRKCTHLFQHFTKTLTFPFLSFMV